MKREDRLDIPHDKQSGQPGRAREFRQTNLAAFAGFVVILLATVVLSIVQLRTVYGEMEQVVSHHNLKTELATEMQVAGLVRTESLYRMLILDDPFERDAMFLRYNGAAFRIGKARQRLREFPMDPGEQRLYSEQGAVIARVVEAQERVIDLVARDRMDEARKVMLDQAMPLQTEVHATFEAMRRQQAEKTEQAMTLASQAYAGTLWMLAIVGLAALAGSGAIALLAYRRTHRIALHDVLTGLLTRGGFHDAVENEIAQRQRDGGAFGLLYLDLDRFKPVNDAFGHAAGDGVLKEAAQRLRQCVRKGDIVARIGGDEFAVGLCDIRSSEDCRVVARKIEAAFDAPFIVGCNAHDVGASIGIASYPDAAGSADELIAAADRAMYASKRERDMPASSPDHPLPDRTP